MLQTQKTATDKDKAPSLGSSSLATVFEFSSRPVGLNTLAGLQIQKKKATGKGKKPGVRNTKVATFFDFFSPPVVPDREDELTQELMVDLQEGLERDYELGWVLYKSFYKLELMFAQTCLENGSALHHPP